MARDQRGLHIRGILSISIVTKAPNPIRRDSTSGLQSLQSNDPILDYCVLTPSLWPDMPPVALSG